MRKITLILLVAFLAVPSLAQAQQRDQNQSRQGRGGPTTGRMYGGGRSFYGQRPEGLALIQNALSQINLTSQQKEKVDKIAKSLVSQIKEELTDEQKAKLDALLAQARFSALVGDRTLEYALGQLKLTDEQKQKMMPILQAHAEARQAYQQKTEAQRQQLMDQFRKMRESGNMDRQKMGELFGQFRQLREGGPGRDALVAKLLPVLNAEQTAQLKKIMEESARRRSRWSGRSHNNRDSNRDGSNRDRSQRGGQQGGGNL